MLSNTHAHTCSAALSLSNFFTVLHTLICTSSLNSRPLPLLRMLPCSADDLLTHLLHLFLQVLLPLPFHFSHPRADHIHKTHSTGTQCRECRRRAMLALSPTPALGPAPGLDRLLTFSLSLLSLFLSVSRSLQCASDQTSLLLELWRGWTPLCLTIQPPTDPNIQKSRKDFIKQKKKSLLLHLFLK